MGNVLNAAVSFPAIIFTVTSVFLFGFWVVTTALGSGFDSIADIEGDLDIDADVDSDAASGLLRPVLELLGIAGMPLLLGLNVMSIIAWAISMIAQLAAGDDGRVGTIVGLAVLLLALIVGRVTSRAVGGRLSAALAPTRALRRNDLLGNVCTITTQKVTPDFGQAEVRDREGGSLIVQVRSDESNNFSAGDQALIFDLVDDDSGAFLVMSNPELDQ